jgi:hypothetical protein
MSATDGRAKIILNELRRRDAWVAFHEFGWDLEDETWRRKWSPNRNMPETIIRNRLRQLVEAGLVEAAVQRRSTSQGMRDLQVWRAVHKGDTP